MVIFIAKLQKPKQPLQLTILIAITLDLFFKGTNGTSNGGQFMLFNVILNEGSQTYATFADMIDKLENNFNDMDLGLYVPTIVNSSDFSIASEKQSFFSLQLTFTAA